MIFALFFISLLNDFIVTLQISSNFHFEVEIVILILVKIGFKDSLSYRTPHKDVA